MNNTLKVVITSGGFDPVHIGHVRCFKEASSLGDCLIVILNSDEFLKKKKNFVFMKFAERCELLESIKYVDVVLPCIDSDDTVCLTLEVIVALMKLKHSKFNIQFVFAKGGDRDITNIPEKETCERLNIDIMTKIGGGKVQSSSDLIEDFVVYNNSVIKKLLTQYK